MEEDTTAVTVEEENEQESELAVEINGNKLNGNAGMIKLVTTGEETTHDLQVVEKALVAEVPHVMDEIIEPVAKPVSKPKDSTPLELEIKTTPD